MLTLFACAREVSVAPTLDAATADTATVDAATADTTAADALSHDADAAVTPDARIACATPGLRLCVSARTRSTCDADGLATLGDCPDRPSAPGLYRFSIRGSGCFGNI